MHPSAVEDPTIGLAARLAFSPATEPAPGAKNARLLDVAYEGIPFPNYTLRFGAVPTGQRVERLAGRPALTVFYRLRSGARLSYTVFAGPPVPARNPTRRIVFEGVILRVVSVTSHLGVLTLVRNGHTCVLAAPTAADVVLELAKAPLQVREA